MISMSTHNIPFNITPSNESIPTMQQKIISTPTCNILDSLDNIINIGSRKSQLAIKQSEIALQILKENIKSTNDSESEAELTQNDSSSISSQISDPLEDLLINIIKISTLGDKNQNQPLYSFGGKSVWTSELENSLINNESDLIVHSLKDVPTNLPSDFELSAILKREDPRDAVCMKSNSPYKKLSDLPAGSIVGTSSVRRSSQLLKNYPHLQFKSIRGSLNTRLAKLDAEDSEFQCVILAAAGLIRIDLQDRITEYLNNDQMFYAVGQGAIGIEIRKPNLEKDSKKVIHRLKLIKKLCHDYLNHKETAISCIAERSLLRTLEGGCSVPVGVFSQYDSINSTLSMKAIVLNIDGTNYIESEINDYKLAENDQELAFEQAEKCGLQLALKLKELGAQEILDSINFDQISKIKQDGLTK